MCYHKLGSKLKVLCYLGVLGHCTKLYVWGVMKTMFGTTEKRVWSQDKVFYFFKSQKWLLMYLEYLKFFALEDHPWDLVGIIKKDGGGLMEWRRNEG